MRSIESRKEESHVKKRSLNNLVRRYLTLLVGLLIMSFGVAFSIKAGLGTSPVSSVPYVLSLIVPMTVGETTILINCLLVLLQILLLRRQFELVQLIQVPVAIAFGYLTDLAVWVLSPIVPTAYWQQWLFCVLGILLVGIGVSFEVTADVVTMAGEGVALALCKTTKLPFAKAKITVDCSLVVIAIVLSFLFLHTLAGVREGTIAAALFVGMTAKQVNRPMSRIGNLLLA